MSQGTLPKALRKGDTIAFVSPSARLNPHFPTSVSRAKRFFESHGYKVQILFTTPPSKTIQESIHHRITELHAAFANPEINAILCTVGGTTANELLPHIDYDLIRQNPKIFCGYSDITLLHHALFVKAGLRTFYGPAAITEFGDAPGPMEFTAQHFFHVLEGKPVGVLPRSMEWAPELPDFLVGKREASEEPRRVVPSPKWRWIKSGSAKGRFFGGCLTPLPRLVGTPCLPSADLYAGKILLLETPMGEKTTVPLPLQRAQAAVADLVNSGIIGAVVGIVVGRSFAYDEELKRRFEEMLVAFCELAGMGGPVVVDVDTGHTSPVLTLPMNAVLELDAERDLVQVLEEVVVV